MKEAIMRVIIGKKGLCKTTQERFPEQTKCLRCGAVARIGFVAHEEDPVDEDMSLCELHKCEDDNLWLHDNCCVAVYFCTKCLEPVALYNQA